MIPSAVELAASQYGLQLISYDRPGYGDSPARPGRWVADAAADARAIAAKLDLSRLAVWGHSGGGPYALACAALAPDLVVAACVFASMAPADAEGLDFLATWPQEDREELELFFSQPELARELRWSRAQERLPALALELAGYLALVQQDTICRDDQGWWDDNVAYLTPWGFDPASIKVPVQLWHGEQDQAVPPAQGRWLAGRIPGVDSRFLADDDHGSIHDKHLPEAYTWLTRQFIKGLQGLIPDKTIIVGHEHPHGGCRLRRIMWIKPAARLDGGTGMPG